MATITASQMAHRRWANTTPEQRSAHAKKMVMAREKRKKGKAKKKSS
jgi:acyl-CoA reductase-like NAD-dependent aldehyde dehydrogenase